MGLWVSTLIEAGGGEGDRGFVEEKLGRGIAFEMSINKISNEKWKKFQEKHHFVLYA